MSHLAEPIERSGRSTRKPKGEGASRRGEILKAAERLFVECGYEGATIRKIAEEVGVSSTALYMHFRDKNEILATICQDTFAQLSALTDAIEAEGLPPEATIRRQMEAYAAFGFENPNSYRLVYMTRPGESESATDVARSVGRDLFDRLTARFRTLAAAGRLAAPPEVAAQLAWAGVHGVVSLMLTKTYFDWAPREELVDRMIGATLDGLITE